MHRTVIVLGLASALLSAALPVSAQDSQRVDSRQANQQTRIDQGVNSGALTGREATRLERGQQRVANMENRAEADGRLTRSERQHIERAQNVQSRHIARQKHDRQRR
ncbi:MAG TPA: hypothetical protein PKA30_08500 [Accumulibacter sp.]|uniref:hypothetical protein n=1 Tax=Accumulibacter sp. TaxID=2053492 RepID=UPI00261D2D1F|nr:hypothetical protein [Accumulibacter sp.]MDS4056186.1 hypothetical protein [Accumulibacter sp.]HMV05575.1 hypothetical protein [Accumulibacter sp.]HMW63730.1 hypothetical protein [Accumulibacter sp.]HMW81014.1 hypothetical protein [Accumulibacter sp.]HNB68022.1 hypothetical protein [Accumulibacter sp.]